MQLWGPRSERLSATRICGGTWSRDCKRTVADYWMPLVDALLPLAPSQLASVFDSGGLRRREVVEAGIRAFRAVVASTKKGNAAVFDEFRARLPGLLNS